MALLTRSQQAFGTEFARQLGLSTRVVGAQLLNEMNGGAAAQREAAHDYNWLNIGWTDSGQRGTGNDVWRDPISAARASARWVKGEWSVPGFGRAAPGIIAWGRTAGKSDAAQVQALQRSGWASSGYPELPGLVSKYGGHFGLSNAAGAAPEQQTGGGGRTVSRTVAGSPTLSYSGGTDGTALAQLLASSQQTRPQAPTIQSAGLTPPAFLAGAVMPGGYRALPSSGGVSRPQNDLAAQLAAVAQIEGPQASVKANNVTIKTQVPGAGPAAKGGKSVPGDVAPGVEAALQFASARVGTRETSTNAGPKISDWIESFGLAPGPTSPWCGVFVGKSLQAAGVRGIDSRVAGVQQIHEMAAAGEGGFSKLVGAGQVRPGDVIGWGGDHTGIVAQVNRDGTFSTIEGNSSDAVSKRVHPAAGAWFARPAYPGGRR